MDKKFINKQLLTEKEYYSRIAYYEKYISDNEKFFFFLGIISTLTALFLNLDKDKFGQSLLYLQLFLLLLLINSVIILFISTVVWIVKRPSYGQYTLGLNTIPVYAVLIFILLLFLNDNYFKILPILDDYACFVFY